MVDPSKIDELISIVESEYKDSYLREDAERIMRIPTGSFELDVATGGGIPMGRFSRFFGSYSSGKTFTSLCLIRSAQNIHIIGEQYLNSNSEFFKRVGEKILKKWPDGMTCCYYNIEGAWDAVFAQQIGIDLDKVHVFNETTIEGVGEILEVLLSGAHLHIVDSCSAAASIDERNSKITDWHRGLGPRAWGKVLRHIKDKVDHQQNAVVLIDQARIDMTTGAEYAPGGKALEHETRMTLHFKRGKELYLRDGILKPEAEKKPDTLSGQPEADGLEIKVKVRKSHVGQPLRTARLELVFDGVKFDTVTELANMARFFKVVDSSGSWYELPGGNKVQGIKGLKTAISEDEKLKENIIDTVYNHIANNP